MNDETKQAEGQRSAGTAENVQGSPGEAEGQQNIDTAIVSDPDAKGVGAAATGEDTDGVIAEGQPTVSPVGAASEPTEPTSDEGGGADPLKELLTRSQRDYTHAARKITEQGQELRSRDEALDNANARIQHLERQIQTDPSQLQTGQPTQQTVTPAATTPAVPDVTDPQQLNLITNALLDLSDKVDGITHGTVEKDMIKRRYGVDDPEVLAEYERLKDIDRFAAHDLLRDARDITVQQRTAQRKTEQDRQAVVSATGSGEQQASATAPKVSSGANASPPEDVPEVTTRKLTRRERALRLVGL